MIKINCQMLFQILPINLQDTFLKKLSPNKTKVIHFFVSSKEILLKLLKYVDISFLSSYFKQIFIDSYSKEF